MKKTDRAMQRALLSLILKAAESRRARLGGTQPDADRCVIKYGHIERCDSCENLKSRLHLYKGGKYCRECCIPCWMAHPATVRPPHRQPHRARRRRNTTNTRRTRPNEL